MCYKARVHPHSIFYIDKSLRGTLVFATFAVVILKTIFLP